MPTLKKIYVESYAISLKDFSNNLASKELKLEELGFSGFVLGDVNFNILTKLFPHISPTPPKETKEIQASAVLEVERLAVHNKDSFLKVLQTLSNIPRHLDLLINLDVRKISADDFIRIICNSIRNISKKGCIKLKFSQIPELEEEHSEIFKQTLSEYEASKNFFVFGKEHQEKQNLNQELCEIVPQQMNPFLDYPSEDNEDYSDSQDDDDDESMDEEDEDDLEDDEEDEEEMSEDDEDEDSLISEDRFDDIEEDF